ncbi:MAG: hypothetical protein A2534_01560 [Candidatus Magasanikbacteria bacterium RIFOXYD2_FULL_39_9]|uniref:Uncharacterized protein n=1 Tax=Candidatus Magasanikbacteria bacterium RIFOXYD1_FULL_40_23 TaxID=1798705 RepID=A0A1F6P7W5_9BACT|nr:MAG: hypothetical protein A2563_00530 [Candidatus Magasanikbacteria bacterium RIFOXYD1_FULL_40_23]OGH93522.1 MAG: hypothetical protein A2534_01560 [Candidatus Magasanikbacteria bacterium RIFOXYD2_FULL_39_9]
MVSLKQKNAIKRLKKVPYRKKVSANPAGGHVFGAPALATRVGEGEKQPTSWRLTLIPRPRQIQAPRLGSAG